MFHLSIVFKNDLDLQWIVVVFQLLNCVWLLLTTLTVTCQAPLSSTIPQSLLKFMFIKSQLCHLTISSSATLFYFAYNLCQHWVFSIESALPIRWSKYWSSNTRDVICRLWCEWGVWSAETVHEKITLFSALDRECLTETSLSLKHLRNGQAHLG